MKRDSLRVAQGAKLVELTGVAVDVDGDDRARAVGERSLDRRRSEVQRPRVDVGEHRRRPFVDRAVGRRDEGVRRGDDLVAGSDAGCDAEQVEPRRAARDGGGVRSADRLGERLLETVDRRAEREAAGPEHLGDELGLPLVEPRARERDRPDGRHARAMPPRATSRRRRASGSSARSVPRPCRGTPAAARASPGRRRSRDRRRLAPGPPRSWSRP